MSTELGLLVLMLLPCITGNKDGGGGGGGTQQYCQSETFSASCEAGHVMEITRARYGRLRLGRCVTQDFGYMGCDNDVMQEMDAACSGRRSCEVRVDESSFPSATPCHKDLKSYLEVSYRCIAVAKPHQGSCSYSTATTIGGQSGYIASVATEDSGCGTADSPWLIQVPEGQRINLTLLDFGVRRRNHTSASTQGSQHNLCRVYATLREKSPGRSVTVCGGRQRERHVYTSDTNIVELRILHNQAANEPVYFLFKYRAVGCPDPRTPRFGWVNRQGEHAKVGCKDSDVTWNLVCLNGTWHGNSGNCTKNKEEVVEDIKDRFAALPHGVAVAVVITIALLIGGVILLIGLFCIKIKTRRPRRREAANYKFPPSVSDYDSVEKRCLKTTIIGHAPVAVATDLNCRENDYACMKYMSAHPDSMDEDNILNHSTETYCSDYSSKPIAVQPCVACANSLNRDPNLKLYESPETRIRILRPDVVSADKAHYFDLDPDSSLREVTLPRPQQAKASATNYNTLK